MTSYVLSYPLSLVQNGKRHGVKERCEGVNSKGLTALTQSFTHVTVDVLTWICRGETKMLQRWTGL